LLPIDCEIAIVQKEHAAMASSALMSFADAGVGAGA
jgi:hypothetical protein